MSIVAYTVCIFFFALCSCSYGVVLPGSDDFLSNWQGSLAPAINSATIFDVSLPGTHDTVTFDLSIIPSVGAWDDHDFISELLHTIFELVDKVPAMEQLGDWIRTQSQTQRLNLTQQLNSGIRFIDFRNMYSTVDFIDFQWFGLHFLQTNDLSLNYLKEIRSWMNDHPTEWIVMWVSKHGNADACGNDQYPNVSIPVKQKYWEQLTSIMGDLLVDTQRFPVNTTSIGTLLQNSMRVLVLASDWSELTSKSPYALDAALHLDNELPSLGHIETDVPKLIDYMENDLPTVMRENKEQSIFTLMSMAGVPAGDQGLASFFLRFFPATPKVDEKKCAAGFQIPNMTDFCPLRLLDCGYLNNYYSQHVFEAALQSNVMANAIYLDGLDESGLIHTGVGDDDVRAYGYADTMLLINVNRVCAANPQPQCQQLQETLAQRRQQHPMQLWDDDNGRLSQWPPMTIALTADS